MVTTPEAPQAVNGQHSENRLTEIMVTRKRRGRPPGDKVMMGVKIPAATAAIVKRRAENAGMSWNEYLARIIEHEVVRSHHKRKR